MTTAPRSGPIRPQGEGPGILLDITPESAGWSNVAFAVAVVAPGAAHRAVRADRETNGIPISDETWEAIKGAAAKVGVNAVPEVSAA